MGIINTRMTLSAIDELFEICGIHSPLNPMYADSPESNYLDWTILSDGEIYLAFWHSKYVEEKHQMVDHDSIKIIGGDSGFFGSIYSDPFSAVRYARSQSGWKKKDPISMGGMISVIEKCEKEASIGFEYKPERERYIDRLSNQIIYISWDNHFSLIRKPTAGEDEFFISTGDPSFTSFKVYPKI